jgi:hypothetical protein
VCKTLRNPTEPHDSRTPPTCRAPRAAPRRAPRSRVRGRRPPRRAPSRTHTPQPSARHTARVPPVEDRLLETSVLATVRGLLVRGCSRRTRSPRARGRGEDHSERPRGEARREAGRVAPRRPCAAVARPLRPSRGAAETRTVRGARAAGGRRAAEPAAREAAWPRRAQGAKARRCGALGPRAEAPGRERTRKLS